MQFLGFTESGEELAQAEFVGGASVGGFLADGCDFVVAEAELIRVGLWPQFFEVDFLVDLAEALIFAGEVGLVIATDLGNVGPWGSGGRTGGK